MWDASYLLWTILAKQMDHLISIDFHRGEWNAQQPIVARVLPQYFVSNWYPVVVEHDTVEVIGIDGTILDVCA